MMSDAEFKKGRDTYTILKCCTDLRQDGSVMDDQ